MTIQEQAEDVTPYWWATSQPFQPPPAEPPQRTDVAIIGGGYTGISAARALAQRGAKVDVLEARSLGWGASTRNGGMMIVGLKHGPQQLVRQFGPELGRALFESTVRANQFVEELIQSEKIDCAYRRTGHVTAAAKARDVDSLAREAEFLDREFGHPTRLLGRADANGVLGTNRYCGALIDDHSGGLHAARYYHGLAQAAVRAGARLHPQTAVTGVTRTGKTFRVSTARGVIEAGDVLVATNGYTPDFIPELRRRIITFGSYVAATEPLSAEVAEQVVPGNRMLIDTKHILYYWRRTPDDRLLFGGRVSFTPTTIEQSRAALGRAIAELYPRLAGIKIDYAWTGRVGFTFDLLPHLGRLPDGMHYAVGFCGHGVAMGTYLGAQMGAMISSAEAPRSPFAGPPFPKRFFYDGRPWFLPLAGMWFRLLDAL